MSLKIETRVVIICFLAHNCAMGILYGSFGPLITTMQEDMQTSRGLASVGLSIAVLALGLASPLVSKALMSFPARQVMLLGAALNLAGYLALAACSNIYQVIAAYGLLIGPGLAALSIIPPSTLINRWFVRDRGKALGLMFTPVFVILAPIATSFLLLRFGTTAVFLAAAAVFALLLPALHLMVVESPEAVGLLPRGIENAWGDAEAIAEPEITTRQILYRSQFWLMAIAAALLASSAGAVIVQTVPFLISRGIALDTASTLLSGTAAIGLAGAFAFGWLSDRLGAISAFAICAILLAIPWAGLVIVPISVLLYVLLLGWSSLCQQAITTLHGAIVTDLFGRHAYSRVLGVNYFVKLPFVIVSGPAAGFIFDLTGSYDLAIFIFAGMAGLAGLLLIALGLLNKPAIPIRSAAPV